MAPPPAILVPDVLQALQPRPKVRSWDWICEHGRTHKGQPFDGDMIPWCEGVCDAWDNPEVRTITIPWGTRLGKSTIGSQLLTSASVNTPGPGLFSTSTQSLADRIVKGRLYKILEAVPDTAWQLKHPRFRSTKEIELTNSSWHVAWSGSPTQLADLEALWGWANEVDKWSYDERLGGDGGEGDALDQYFERFKENPDHTILLEGSPTTKRHSRMWRLLQRSNNCRYWVPCPRCKKRMVLKLGDGTPGAGGIIFDKHADGSLDPELARETARYECEHCRSEIHNEDRHAMMRAGVWAPEGCSVDRRGRVIGTPKRSSRHWGGQLSSLYSLQLNWGDIAAKFVSVCKKPRSLQMFINGWLGEAWEPYRVKSEPEEVGERLRTDEEPGKIPAWATWVFAGVDVQEEYFVCDVIAVGPGERVAFVERLYLDSWSEVKSEVIMRKFEHLDGGEPLCPALTLVDSGDRTKEVYGFCKSFKGTPYEVMPCKGANNDCGGQAFQRIIIGDGVKGAKKKVKRLALRARGLVRIRVNPFHYEPLIQRQLDRLLPGEDESLQLPAAYADNEEFLKDMCNCAQSPEPSKLEPDKHLWVKRWPDDPNDVRDGYKYARCAADVKFREDWRRAEQRQPPFNAAEVSRHPAREQADGDRSGGRMPRKRIRRGRIPRRGR